MKYILIPIAITIVFSLLWKTKTNAEKKIPNGNFIRTKAPKTLTGFFLFFCDCRNVRWHCVWYNK